MRSICVSDVSVMLTPRSAIADLLDDYLELI